MMTHGSIRGSFPIGQIIPFSIEENLLIPPSEDDSDPIELVVYLSYLLNKMASTGIR